MSRTACDKAPIATAAALTRGAMDVSYEAIFGDIVNLLEAARRAAARTVNAVMTATYWEIGRRIVEYEQRGAGRAEYGGALLKRLATDLGAKYGRGYSERNLEYMRLFFTGWPISQTLSAKSPPDAKLQISQTPSAESSFHILAARFPLPWSHYVRLLSVDSPHARVLARPPTVASAPRGRRGAPVGVRPPRTSPRRKQGARR